MMQPTKIALVQMQAIINNKQRNLAKIKEYIKQASNNGCHIICFPETAVHGYSKSLYLEGAEPISEIADELKVMSEEYGICILVGMTEGAENNKKPYITQLVIMPKKETAFYRKTHLGESEKAYFSHGNSLPVFQTATAKIGVQICWELHFPEISTIMSLNGAEIIFAPHASPNIIGDRREIWLKYLVARAYDNKVYIAACNLIGENGKGQCFGGGALVIDPKGNVIAEDFNGQESILYVDLSNEKVNRVRTKKAKTMKDRFYLQSRRPELYKDLVNIRSEYNKAHF
ncbi:nitrilase-related carbon-nitrogen hydrolase [Alkaliphilus peptidifermentans]|uniref:Predicted amidohydrolase n=1 Tax=Alkaliphilus peptidifermentans DSM 18978 TaxID=1120976 RepID=A0A1G5KP61_9FIRM|nr:nitrilase-related carbon-nitrogen hydrolase [Alkaliphilus peptidifermentans]SCZ02385.1 Predicted amidohydrolase [Alkaliphilus peptidifermentans DSM 18978]